MEKPTEALSSAEIEIAPPSVLKHEVAIADFVLPGDWDLVHQEGWTWEGNIPGFVRGQGDVFELEFRGRQDAMLAEHLLAHGDKIRFGYPVTWEIRGTHDVYETHTDRPGIAYYQAKEGPPASDHLR